MFFTNKNSHTDDNKSSVFVYGSVYKKEGQAFDNKYDFQLKFDLPYTTKKLKIVIEKEQDEFSNAISDPAVTTTKTTTKDGRVVTKRDTHYEAGANFFLKQTKYFVSFVHFGIRLDMPLNPSLKLDIQKDFKAKYFNVSLLEKVIYYRQEGLQNVSQMILNKRLSKTLQADFGNSLVWSDETDELIFRHSFTLYHEVGEEKVFSYAIGANAKFKPGYYYDSYDASISYRQRIFSNWLYATWTIGADFPKVSHFKDEKFAQFRIDMFFKEGTNL